MKSGELKGSIIKKFAISKHDTGSCEVQIALLSARIQEISEHLKTHPKDKHSQRGLLCLIGRRKSFLKYVKKNNPSAYVTLTDAINRGIFA